MARAKKKGTSPNGEFSLFDDGDSSDGDSEEDLPRDEAGRAKIKHQYVDLLGIRVHKLAGRILNRERINKTLEGIYFVCVRCQTVCHNLDEGLVEDSENKTNICVPCSKQPAEVPKPPAKRSSSRSGADSAASKKKAAARTKAASAKTAAKSSRSSAAKSSGAKSSAAKSSAAKSSVTKSGGAKSSASRSAARTSASRKKR